MTYAEKKKFERLVATFLDNLEITRKYSEYLTELPELITPDMVKALTEDGGVCDTDALVAILSEAFGYDYSKPRDRRLIRDYLTPSVRLLDAEKYKSDPYYTNIKIPDAKVGDFELTHETYAPYRAVIADDMIINPDFSEIPPLGFFKEPFSFPAVLEGGNEWMTLTPVDLDTSVEAIDLAHGKVVTFGLGLGYYAYMASEKESVESVTVVELSPDVIRLFLENIFPQFPHGEKIRIVNADAFEYAEKIMPAEHFDVAFVDTWRDASDGAPMYERMKRLEHLSGGTRFIYWIEGFIRSRLRAEKFSEIYDEYIKLGEELPYSFDEVAEELSKI